ncbi:hypothetical protein VTK56DRAFT_7669 [Thermocarpiscus australiensis]
MPRRLRSSRSCERRVEIPAPLDLAMAEKQEKQQVCSPVYRILDDPADAALWFRLGFTDTNIWRSSESGRDDDFFPSLSLPYIKWLADHGVDPLRVALRSPSSEEEPGRRGPFTAHHTFWRVGEDLGEGAAFLRANSAWWRGEKKTGGGGRAWIDGLNASQLATGMTDKCRCKCSPGGCTPMAYLLKGMFSSFDTFPDLASVRDVVDALARYLGWFGAGFTPRHHSTVLRFMTYTALGIPHTCCNPFHFSLWGEQPTTTPTTTTAAGGGVDEHEFEDEHEYELSLLDELMDDFESEAGAVLQDADRGLAGIIHFWRHSWLSRIGEVRRHLDGSCLSDGERRAAEAIGVIWDQPQHETGRGLKKGKEENESEVDAKREEERNRYQGWFKWFHELENLVPE